MDWVFFLLRRRRLPLLFLIFESEEEKSAARTKTDKRLLYLWHCCFLRQKRKGIIPWEGEGRRAKQTRVWTLNVLGRGIERGTKDVLFYVLRSRLSLYEVGLLLNAVSVGKWRFTATLSLGTLGLIFFCCWPSGPLFTRHKFSRPLLWYSVVLYISVLWRVKLNIKENLTRSFLIAQLWNE
jgi:hypothetical protein